jgi:predicted dienelactone hydrolase
MRQILAVAAGLVVLAVTACSAPAAPRSDAPSATPAGPATLPAPTGAHPVGSTVLHLKDASRRDPWNLDAEARELKVTLWYPTQQRDGQRAPYMTAKESELTMKGWRVAGVPYDTLSKTRTNAIKDAPPAGQNLPLVLLSPDFAQQVSILTTLAEDLASRGYVVAGIDHTYENHATTFPDGRVAECIACLSQTDTGFGTRVVQGRAADVSFVLDQLPSTWDGSDLINRSRIAMVGAAIGGASAMAAMLNDARVRAGVNMDGTMYARIPKTGFSRPFLLMGTEEHTPGSRFDNSWDRDWKLLTGWKRWLVLSGTKRESFTDGLLLAGAFDIKPVYGDLPAARSVDLTRTYVAAFLDHHLQGRRQPLLDKPSPRHREVEFCAVGSLGRCERSGALAERP